MTDLTSAASIARKSLWIVPFLLLILVLIVLVVFHFSPKVSQAPNLNKPDITSVSTIKSTFTATDLSPIKQSPEKLPVYSLQAPSNLLDQAQEISTKLGFSDSPQKTSDVDLGEGLTYSSKGTLLANSYEVLNIYKDTLTLAKNAFNQNPQRLSIADLKNKASGFLNNLGYATDLETASITFFKITSHDTIETDNPDQATYVNFSFYPAIDGYPVVTSKFKNNISIDFAGNILQLTLRNQGTAQKGAEYKVINFDDALRELLAGSGILINFEEPQTSTAKNLSVSLQKAYLAYYSPLGTSTEIQPVWIFEGIDTKSQSLLRATFVIPAIESQYFKNQP